MDPSSRHAYLTNIYEGTVAVVDLVEQEVVGRIQVGEESNGISVSYQGGSSHDGLLGRSAAFGGWREACTSNYAA